MDGDPYHGHVGICANLLCKILAPQSTDFLLHSMALPLLFDPFALAGVIHPSASLADMLVRFFHPV